MTLASKGYEKPIIVTVLSVKSNWILEFQLIGLAEK